MPTAPTDAAAEAAFTRHLPLEGVENFRDYGEYGAAGRRLRRGRLFRAAHQARATDADLKALSDLGLAVIVDLRRPAERELYPNRRPEGCAATVILREQVEEGEPAEAPHVAFLRETDLSEDAVHQFMLGYYTDAPFKPEHLELFSRYFAAVAETDGPVLIHCAAGKDRTGMLAAFTHHLLGVGHDDLMDDYLLTNQAARIEARAPEVAQNLTAAFGKVPSDAAVRTFLGVEARYLQRALDEIAARHGSLDAYLRDALGVTPEMRGKIEDRLLA